MEMTSAFSNINWIAVIIAAVSSFIIGGIWYGPLFGRSWMAEFGFSEQDLEKRGIIKTFGISLLMALIAAFNLAMFIGPEASISFASFAGLFAGLGWVATFLAILYVFEMRSLKAYLINAGYCVLALTTMGFVLGVL